MLRFNRVLLLLRHPLILLFAAGFCLLLHAGFATRLADAQVVSPTGPTPPVAQPPPPSPPPIPTLPPEIQDALTKLSNGVVLIEQSLDKGRDREEDLVNARTEIEALQADAQRASEALTPRLQAIRSQIEKLGPPPAKDAPAEAPALAEERRRLNAEAGEIDAAIKKADVLQVRSRQLSGRVQEQRHALFARDLLKRTVSPLKPSIWQDFWLEADAAARSLASIFAVTGNRISERLPLFVGILGLAGIVYGLLRYLLTRIARRWQRINARTDPASFFARATVAAIRAPALAIPSIAALAGAVWLLESFDFLGLNSQRIIESAVAAFAVFAIITALTVALLEPYDGRWRLFDLSDRSARRISLMLTAMALTYGIDLFTQDLIRILYLPLSISITSTFVVSIMLAGLLIGVIRTRFDPALPLIDERRPIYWPRWLKLPLLIVAIAVIAASLSGYIALGRFIVGHILLTGSGLMLLFLLHLATQAFAGHLEDDGHAIGRLMATHFKLDGERRERIAAVVLVVLNVLLALVGGPLLLLSWGFSAGEILGWLNSLVFGFDIGHFRISLAKLLIAAGLFLGVVFVTRLLQRWLDATVFPKARLDAGVTHSVRTGISYGGFGLAALAAVSYAGLDISNLAIVAGALSVGIGFGLQSIVNNFVSGLILLVERPIKVGDWIVVKDREGVVRSINVRATEIETFDRSSLIVPNSELVTGPVVNWTHRNSVGRIVIKVGVAYSNDAELVRTLLLQVAEKNIQVLSHPKPVAVLDNLGDSALEFSLRVYLGDINTALSVQTELRIAILKAFADAGITFPVPQTEVLLRDLDAIKAALARGG